MGLIYIPWIPKGIFVGQLWKFHLFYNDTCIALQEDDPVSTTEANSFLLDYPYLPLVSTNVGNTLEGCRLSHPRALVIHNSHLSYKQILVRPQARMALMGVRCTTFHQNYPFLKCRALCKILQNYHCNS